MNKNANKKGFTIMEMLIVVAIIAVLVAIAIPTFNGALTKSKEAADVANIRAAYAEEMVAVLTDESTAKTPDQFKSAIDSKLNYAGKLKAESGKNTITYEATKLKTDTVPDGKYTWELTVSNPTSSTTDPSQNS